MYGEDVRVVCDLPGEMFITAVHFSHELMSMLLLLLPCFGCDQLEKYQVLVVLVLHSCSDAKIVVFPYCGHPFLVTE